MYIYIDRLHKAGHVQRWPNECFRLCPASPGHREMPDGFLHNKMAQKPYIGCALGPKDLKSESVVGNTV